MKIKFSSPLSFSFFLNWYATCAYVKQPKTLRCLIDGCMVVFTQSRPSNTLSWAFVQHINNTRNTFCLKIHRQIFGFQYTLHHIYDNSILPLNHSILLQSVSSYVEFHASLRNRHKQYIICASICS